MVGTNINMNHPEVDIDIAGNWLGEGITGIKGVLKSMEIKAHEMEATCISLEVMLTSVQLGEGVSENVGGDVDKIIEKIGRYIDF